MVLIDKNKVSNFIKSPSVGEANEATHSIFVRKIRDREKFEEDFFSSLSEDEKKGTKNNVFIDKDGDKIISYISFFTKNIDTAQADDFFIGYDGEKYLFGVNEDVQLYTKKVPKMQESIYGHFKEYYEENNEIPKELKFVLGKMNISNISFIHEKFKDYLKQKDKEISKDAHKKEINSKEVIEKDSKVFSEKVKNTEIERKASAQLNEIGYPNTIHTVFHQTSNIPQMSEEQKQRIEAFKRQKAIEQINKKESNNINFRNIKYPKPSNNLEKAIFLSGGGKPILVYGMQGSGKTWTAENYSKKIEEETGIPVSFYSIILEKNLDKADIIGSPVLKDDAFHYQKMSEAFMSARDGNLTVFLIDEFFRLKDMGTFFNLFGDTHYKLDTGRQLEIVELVTEDIDGNLQTSNFTLLDRKIANPNMIIEPNRIQLLKPSDDICFKSDLPQQKIKDRLALGEIPVIYKEDYIKNNLDSLKTSSFFTSEVIKAPIENLIIIAAGNVGKDFVSHFRLGDDRALDSRFALCEMEAVTLKRLIMSFEQELIKAKDKGYIMWDSTKTDIDMEIKNLTKIVNNFYSEMFKLVKQGNFGSPSTFSYRNFTELALNLTKQTEITSETIYECIMAQKLAVVNHVEDNVGRVPVKAEAIAYETVAKKTLGITSGNDVSKQNKMNKNLNEDLEIGVSSGVTR